MQRELVELVRCQMHAVTIFYSRDRRRGAAKKREMLAQRVSHLFDADARHAQQRAAVAKRATQIRRDRQSRDDRRAVTTVVTSVAAAAATSGPVNDCGQTHLKTAHPFDDGIVRGSSTNPS